MTIKYKTPDGQIIEIQGRLFVCRDRHGKDVYEGDRIRWLKLPTVVWVEGTLEWNTAFLRWSLYSPRNNTLYPLRDDDEQWDIELIEGEP